MTKKKTFFIESLGCAKNSVDSESMANLLLMNGYRPVDKPGLASVMIVNTCGFITAARLESIEALSNLSKKKKSYQKLIAAGCLSQRDPQLIVDNVEGVDGIISTRRWMDIIEIIDKLENTETSKLPLWHLPDVPTMGSVQSSIPQVAIQGTSAYMKIADGCRRGCAFCSIPLIKGTAVSRPMQDLISDVKFLADREIKEINLIAQDITDYGSDLGLKDALPDLLEKINREVPEIPWIRLLYTYPGAVSDRLIGQLCESRVVLPYLDMPLQHAHPDMLKRMKRPSNMDWTYKTIQQLRSSNPDIALRTTFIVGYPGETEKEFESLLDFLREIEFDRVGAFMFSFEPGTSSEPLGDPIPSQLKEERYNLLMAEQEQISLGRNQKFVGKTLDILVEGMDNNISIGRSYRDAPEIDGMVIVEGALPVGGISRVHITGAMEYDLVAHPV